MINMKIRDNIFGLYICIVPLTACVSTQASNLKAALLVAPSPDSAKIVQEAITKLLNGQKVKISDNVFSAKSEIVIERAQLTDRLGNQLNGRVKIEPVDSFSLLKKKQICYLRHNNNSNIIILPSLQCKEK